MDNRSKKPAVLKSKDVISMKSITVDAQSERESEICQIVDIGPRQAIQFWLNQ